MRIAGMNKLIKQNYKEWMVGAAFALYAMGLWLYRREISGEITFIFLIWNLFLAFIPYAASFALLEMHQRKSSTWLMVPVAAGWLLFFPNAPYILTDLFHLRPRTGVPYWFDLLMLLSFALSGLWFGLVSLNKVHKVAFDRIGKVFAGIVALTSLILGAFGVYLGRFLRWNSWDIIQRPGQLLNDILSRFTHPFEHPRTLGMTIGFGMLFLLCWLAFSDRGLGLKLRSDSSD